MVNVKSASKGDVNLVDVGGYYKNPVNAVLDLYSRCNSRCQYCDVWQHPHYKPSEVSPWLKIIDELGKIGVKEVVISGGEPLLYPMLDDIVKKVATRGMRTHLITNGILLTERRTQQLVDAGLTGISFSLDSLDSQIYEFIRGIPLERVLNALDVLENLGKERYEIYRAINCVITRVNLSNLETLVDEAHNRGLFIAFQAYNCPPGHAVEGFLPAAQEENSLEKVVGRLITRKLAGAPIVSSVDYLRGIPGFLCRRALPDGFQCYAGYIGVNVDGLRQLRPCWMMEPVGSLDDAMLADLWHSPAFNAARERMARLECDRCWLQCHTDIDGICREERR